MPRSVDHAYRFIHDAIIRAEFSPGMHLKEQELSAAIGVSRTPIREALRRLANEGLVVFTRYQGTFVQKYGLEDLYEIYELRGLLGSHAAGLAAANITNEQIDELELTVKSFENSIAAPTKTVTHLALNRFITEFHMLVVKAANSRRTEAMFGPLLKLPASLLQQLPPPEREDAMRVATQFRELISAFRARDAEWAKALLHAMVMSSRRRTYDAHKQAPSEQSIDAPT